MRLMRKVRYCSDRSASESVRCSVSGRVNAIAGANRQQQCNQQQTLAESESSTSTSDESSDDDEMDTEPAETVAVQSTVPSHDTDDDVKADSAPMDTSADKQHQHIVETSAARDTEAVTERKPACHIAVNRTAEIQVFCIHEICICVFFMKPICYLISFSCIYLPLALG